MNSNESYARGRQVALSFFGAEKVAFHADDRMRERIKEQFPEGTLDDLRAQAAQMTVAPGRYQFQLNGASGNPAATAAFKTVGKKNHLVLATVLPPGVGDSAGQHLLAMRQPRGPLGQAMGKVDASAKQYTIRMGADGKLSCGCKDFKYRRAADGTDCKHIAAFKQRVNAS